MVWPTRGAHISSSHVRSDHRQPESVRICQQSDKIFHKNKEDTTSSPPPMTTRLPLSLAGLIRIPHRIHPPLPCAHASDDPCYPTKRKAASLSLAPSRQWHRKSCAAPPKLNFAGSPNSKTNPFNSITCSVPNRQTRNLRQWH